MPEYRRSFLTNPLPETRYLLPGTWYIFLDTCRKEFNHVIIVERSCVAIITGAGRGIGRALALAFAHEGAQMILAARTERELTETANACNEMGGSALAVTTDISKWDQVQSLINRAIDEAGHVDILVNSAGIYGPIGPTADIDMSSWRNSLGSHLHMSFYHSPQTFFIRLPGP